MQKRLIDSLPLAECTKDGPCLLWPGRLSAQGYSRMKRGTKGVFGHRVAYEMFRGPIPEGLTIDHVCRARACVNPWHLDAVTIQENLRRKMLLVVSCKRGHPFTADNVWFNKTEGKRVCRECQRQRSNQWLRDYREKHGYWYADRNSKVRAHNSIHPEATLTNSHSVAKTELGNPSIVSLPNGTTVTLSVPSTTLKITL